MLILRNKAQIYVMGLGGMERPQPRLSGLSFAYEEQWTLEPQKSGLLKDYVCRRTVPFRFIYFRLSILISVAPSLPSSGMTMTFPSGVYITESEDSLPAAMSSVLMSLPSIPKVSSVIST
jgi:hypothetical protein